MTREELFEQVASVAVQILDAPREGRARMLQLVQEAKDQRCTVKFEAAVMAEVESVKGERAWKAAEDDGRVPMLVGDPNEQNALIRDVGGHVATRRLAFTFGGIVSRVKESQSAYGRVKLLGIDGEVLRDAQGEPMTEPARVLRAGPMRGPDAHVVALDACAFFKRTDEGVRPASIPAGLPARMVVAWDDILPPLAGLATYPVWHDGRLLTGDGYHEPTGLWLRPADAVMEPFDSPQDAAAWLREEWLADFPFASDRDLAAALMVPASILMAKTALRGAMGPPLMLITAPSAGTGKSLLASVLIAAVLGEMPPSLGYPESEEEREKRVGAAILEGWPALYLDNLKSGSFIGYRDVTLTKLVTDTVFSGRILGLTQLFKGPAGLAIVATGNNIVVDGDMARRTVECRLEAPEGVNLARRTFRHVSLARWTLENRGRILGALQIILQAKAKGQTIGGFPEWSALVAHPILQALGISADDFFQPWVEAAEEDAKGMQMPGVYPLLQAIAALKTGETVQPIDGDWFTSAEIVKGIRDTGASHVLQIAPKRWDATVEPLDARALGFLLKRNAGAIYDGDAGRFKVQVGRMNLGSRTEHKVKPVFRVKRYAPTAPPPPHSAMPILGGGLFSKDKAPKKDGDKKK